MTIEQVILNNFLISLEQDSNIFEGRLTVDEYINLKSAIASAIKALGEQRLCENCGADMRKKRDGKNVSQTFVDEWIGEKQHGRDRKAD